MSLYEKAPPDSGGASLYNENHAIVARFNEGYPMCKKSAYVLSFFELPKTRTEDLLWRI